MLSRKLQGVCERAVVGKATHMPNIFVLDGRSPYGERGLKLNVSQAQDTQAVALLTESVD